MSVLDVPSAAFPTIQSAVNAAAPGDTIRVAAGTFTESVTIGADKDRLSIIGAGQNGTILLGNPSLPVGFAITDSTHVTISGFTIQTFANSGITIATSDNVVRDVAVSNNGVDGIFVFSSGSRNLFFAIGANANGGDGIEIDGENNYVICSQCDGNSAAGIDIVGAHNLVLENVAIHNEHGLVAIGDATLAIANKLVGNQTGVNLRSSDHLLFDNELSANAVFGAILDVQTSLILKNEAHNNQVLGIGIGVGTANRVIANEVEANGGGGVRLDDRSVRNVVDQNAAEHNGGPGIALNSAAADNALRRNKLEANNPDILAPPPANTANVFDENDCETSAPEGLCE